MKQSNKTKLNMPIAVIGMGCLFPKAPGLKEYWRLLANNVDGITQVPKSHWSTDDYFNKDPQKPDHVYCKWGGFLSPVTFDPSEFGIPPNSLEATDTSQLLSLLAAKMALEDAGYWENREFDRERTSVILGVTGTQELVIPLGARLGHPKWRKALNDSGIEPEKTEEVIERISNSYVKWQENSFPGLLGNVVAGRIANRLNLGGTNCVVDAACASSMGALNFALMELVSGRSDMVLTGGADTLNDIFMHSCFAQTKILSSTGNASPFSENADGTVLGEGVGILILKRLEHAKKDKDKIYAVIKGIGSSSDGRSQSIYAPAIKGQAKALKRAYTYADVDPDTVQLIEAHGTGTRVGDVVEFDALSNVFGRSRPSNKCALGSVKSMIGHTKAAAGSAGLIKTIIALHNKIIPPSLKADKPDPKLNINQSSFYINPKTRPWFSDKVSNKDHPRRAGVSSFGFGGSNFHVVVEEFEPNKTQVSWDGSAEIIALSGSSKQELISSVQSLKKEITNQNIAIKAAQTRKDFIFNNKYRLLITVNLVPDKNDDIQKLLNSALESIETSDQANGKQLNIHNKNIFFAGPKKPGKIAFVFPGQGSQYVNMGNDLACIFPEAMNAIENARNIFNLSKDIVDFIYPLPAQNSEEKEAQNKALRQTDIAQPALCAISLCMLKILKRFGIAPDATCGHSFGELPALYAGSWIDEQTLFDLSMYRGRFMAEAGKGSEKGRMLAVQARLDELEQLLQTSNLDVVLANKNSPFQGVLSGSASAIANAEKICKNKRFKTMLLPVSAAFHSKLVESARKPFAQKLETVSIQPTNIPVFSNTTGLTYPDNSEKAKQLLGNQLAYPVDFLGEIQNLYKSGIRTFIEVGPKSVLTGLIKDILKDKNIRAISVDSSSGKGSGIMDLARLLCELASAGYPVKLQEWESPCPKIRKQKMSIMISGANYTNPNSEKKLIQNTARGTDAERPICIPTREHGNGKNKYSEKELKDNLTYNPKKDSKSKMNKTTQQSEFATDALKVIQEGLKSMQTLQTQTAETHKKFLETQSEATRTLQYMMEKTRYLAEVSLGLKGQSKDLAKAPGKVEGTDSLNTQKPVYNSVEQNLPGPENMIKPEPISVSDDFSKDVHDSAPADDIKPSTSLSSDANFSEHFETEEFIQPEPEKPQLSNLENNKIQSTLLEVVSELTGYPAEMLGMDMDIEADLGIDSIKRVEILSTLEERIPGLPSVSPEIMGTLKTLGHIVKHLSEEEINNSDSQEEFEKIFEPISLDPKEVYEKIDRKTVSVAEKPFEKKNKISLSKQKKIFVTQDKKRLSDAIVDQLTSSGLNAEIIPETVFSNIGKNKKAIKNACGLIIVADSDYKDDHKSETFLKNSLLLAKNTAKQLISSANQKGALFASVTLLDGGFGFKEKGLENPIIGGLAGLVKTAAIEWEKPICKAIDVDPNWESNKEIAKAIVSELLFSDSSIEVGLSKDLRLTTVVQDLPWSDWSDGHISLNQGDAVVMSGGARGITAECGYFLAQQVKPTMVLLGRSPAPYPEPEWLSGLQTEVQIKQGILKNQSNKLSPIQLDKAYKEYTANREITENINLIKSTGASLEYFQLDIRNQDKVLEVFDQIRSSYGPICAIIHGAGIVQDRLIIDKTEEQFESVFSTKVNGLKTMLNAAKNDSLKYIMLFSSVSARFGNKGQADYAMANEALNKIAHQESVNRKDCRVVALNWGPWDGGMVSPAIKRQFEENNVNVIEKQAGAKSLIFEMSQQQTQPVEVVISAKNLEKNIEKKLSLTVEREINLETHPILESHVIDGKPVVPFALITEWLSHGALHENPGFHLYGLDNMRVLQGIRLNNGNKKIRIMAGQAVKNGSLFEVDVEIRDGILKNGKDMVHARAKAILTDKFNNPPEFDIPELIQSNQGYTKTVDQVYEQILFHGDQLQGINEIIDCSSKGMTAKISPAPLPHQWIKEPLRSRWISDPLVLDSAFQMATIWCFEQKGVPSLPTYSACYRQYLRNFPNQEVTAMWEVKSSTDHMVKGDFTFLTSDNQVAARLEGFEAVMDEGLREAFKRRKVGDFLS